ncbi:MAG: endo-1,4-beta-xylanase [Tyzzerella sp.]|nr:endo-1,4-beta-xylanase [Tyzzerella sp.]
MSRRENALKYFEEQKDLVNDRVNSGIELYRKGYATIKFVLPDGSVLKNVTFKAEQTSHDFNFGCNMFLLDEFETAEKNKIYRETFPKVFNYAIAPFYWDALEPEKGKPRYAADSKKVYRRPAPDLVLDYCNQNNIRVKGHCLVYDFFAPSWLPKDVPGIKREIRKHLIEIAERYHDTIKDWDIINETLWWDCYGDENTTRFYREDDYIEFCMKLADSLPFQRNFINETTGIWEEFKFTRSPYYMLLKNLEADHIPFDAIGMQTHQFIPREREAAFAAARYNPMRIYDILDTYGKFGKPLQISEVSIASYNGDEEDMDIQAELVKNMYKVWFSHKNMDGITYWNLVDGYTFVAGSEDGGALDMTAGENQYGAALLYNDLSPKPAFKALENLINKEWHTCGVFGTNSDTGIATFKGFKGNYDIDFEYNGKKYHKNIHLDGRSDIAEIIVVD